MPLPTPTPTRNPNPRLTLDLQSQTSNLKSPLSQTSSPAPGASAPIPRPPERKRVVPSSEPGEGQGPLLTPARPAPAARKTRPTPNSKPCLRGPAPSRVHSRFLSPGLFTLITFQIPSSAFCLRPSAFLKILPAAGKIPPISQNIPPYPRISPLKPEYPPRLFLSKTTSIAGIYMNTTLTHSKRPLLITNHLSVRASNTRPLPLVAPENRLNTSTPKPKSGRPQPDSPGHSGGSPQAPASRRRVGPHPLPAAPHRRRPLRSPYGTRLGNPRCGHHLPAPPRPQIPCLICEVARSHGAGSNNQLNTDCDHRHRQTHWLKRL